MSVAQTLRMVHRRAARRGAQGRHQRARDTHLHHAVLPQVRSQDYYARKCLRVSPLLRVMMAIQSEWAQN